MTIASRTRGPTTVLAVTDLRTQFHTDEGVVRAVDGVSLELRAGETLGLVGESGSGKSVTALSIMGLVAKPAGEIVSGEVLVDGISVLGKSDEEMRRIRGRTVAMIFQDPMTSLNPLLTVGRQITEVLRLHLGLSKASARVRAIELLAHVGIPSPETRVGNYPHQFSGGMRQRVMLAMALSCKPKVLLADEPTTALDVTIQAQILRLLKDMAKESRTATLIITHDLGVIAGITQRVHVMYAGRIVEKADTSELFDNPKMPYTWGLLRSIARIDDEHGARLTPIEGLPPDAVSERAGCSFEPRCPYRRPICAERDPMLAPIPDAAADHLAACWGTQAAPDGGWLVGVDWRTDQGDATIVAKIRAAAARAGGAERDDDPSAPRNRRPRRAK